MNNIFAIRSERRAGVIISYVQTALSIIIALSYMPIMLGILGKHEYGLYQTVCSVIATLSILDLGFTGSYTHFYFRQKNEGGEDAVSRLNGLFITVYSVIGATAFICGTYLLRHLEVIFGDGLTDLEYEKAGTMMLLLSFNLLTTFVSGVFSAYIRTQERFVFSESLSLIRTVASPFVQLPLITLGFGSVGMTVARFAVNLVCDIAIVIYALTKLRFRAVFSGSERGLFGKVFAFSSLIALNMIVDQINANIDNVILARICGTAEVAVNAVGVMICSYYTLFSTSISKVYTPKIHRLVHDGDHERNAERNRLTEFFTSIGRIQFMILALVSSGFIIFGRDFITLWAGNSFKDAYAVCVLRMLPATVPLIQNVGIEIQRAQHRHYYRAFVYSGMAFANVVMTLLLAHRFGSVGAAFATGTATLFANGLIMNYIYHKKINIDVLRFWRSILSLLKGMIVPFTLGALAFIFVDFTSWITLGLGIVAYSTVYVFFVWRFSANEDEKQHIISMFGKKKTV